MLTGHEEQDSWIEGICIMMVGGGGRRGTNLFAFSLSLSFSFSHHNTTIYAPMLEGGLALTRFRRRKEKTN